MMIRLRRYPIALIVAGLGCVMTISCDGDTVRLAPVKGKVTYKGKPVPIGTISFVPEGNLPAATGNLNPDGTFEMMTYETGDGAAIGKHTVMIIAIDPQSDTLPEARSPMPPLIIPDKYTNNLSSGLTADVEDKDNEINFELTGELSNKRKR